MYFDFLGQFLAACVGRDDCLDERDVQLSNITN